MKRLTTDKPEGNVENSLNLFYTKDQWTWVRGGGPAPDYKDVSLCDLVRMMVKANIPDAELPKDDDNLSMMMHEWLMDELDTAEGIIALLYNAGWAFAELRHRLTYYEDLEEQGRLVIPPCKVGDTVYCILEDSPVYYPDTDGWYISEETVHEITTKGLILHEVEDGASIYVEPFDRIGKTVFLTREEAEKAIELDRDQKGVAR